MGTTRKTIFILEDNDDIRELISILLMEEDYEVKGYPTVKSFTQVMQFAHPDMIVLDVMLGDGNGIKVCDDLKNNLRTQDIPILMMSANTDYRCIKNNCSAEDFISKPFDINDFVNKVDHHLRA